MSECKIVTLPGSLSNPLFDVSYANPCDGSTIEVYRADTHPYPTVTFQVNTNAGECPVSLKVEREGEDFETIIQPNSNRAFTISNVKRISIQCSVAGGQTCLWEVIGTGISYCQEIDDYHDESGD